MYTKSTHYTARGALCKYMHVCVCFINLRVCMYVCVVGGRGEKGKHARTAKVGKCVCVRMCVYVCVCAGRVCMHSYTAGSCQSVAIVHTVRMLHIYLL